MGSALNVALACPSFHTRTVTKMKRRRSLNTTVCALRTHVNGQKHNTRRSAPCNSLVEERGI